MQRISAMLTIIGLLFEGLDLIGQTQRSEAESQPQNSSQPAQKLADEMGKVK